MTETTLFSLQLETLRMEWKTVQDGIGRIDGLVFLLRGWAISFCSAVIGFAYVSSDPLPPRLAVIPLICLWLLDALFKSFQRVYISRSGEIEAYLSSPVFVEDWQGGRMTFFVSPAISSRFGRGTLLERVGEVLRHAFLRNVLFAYLPMTLFLIFVSLVISVR